MSIEERLEYAYKKLDEMVSNGTVNDCVYWNGYIAGILAVKKDAEKNG